MAKTFRDLRLTLTKNARIFVVTATRLTPPIAPPRVCGNFISYKILSFTIECGRSFQPSWADAENVIREVCAGLIALCVATRARAIGPAADARVG